MIGSGTNLKSGTVEGDFIAPLYAAVCNDEWGAVRLLLERGADVNYRGVYGRTPLHQAAFSGFRRIAELLLDHGADTDAVLQDGSTALFYAAKSNHRSVEELLIARGVTQDSRYQSFKRLSSSTGEHSRINW